MNIFKDKVLEARLNNLEDEVVDLRTMVFTLRLELENKEPNYDRRKSAHTEKRKAKTTKARKK